MIKTIKFLEFCSNSFKFGFEFNQNSIWKKKKTNFLSLLGHQPACAAHDRGPRPAPAGARASAEPTWAWAAHSRARLGRFQPARGDRSISAVHLNPTAARDHRSIKNSPGIGSQTLASFLCFPRLRFSSPPEATRAR